MGDEGVSTSSTDDRSSSGGRGWTDSLPLVETPLLAGDVTEAVVRVGETVRRSQGPHSAYVHALLDHLERVGFDGAPRYLGQDDRRREVLSWVDGEVAGQPRPGWLAAESRLVSVGRLLRRYDDAAASFVAPPGVSADRPEPASVPPGPSAPPQLAGHLDVTPDNVVFRGGEAVALIDFDLAGPATRLDEVYNALMWWGPLADPQDRHAPMRDLDVPRRCRLLADAYGLEEADRLRFTEVARLRSTRSWHLMKHRSEALGGGWRRMWEAGIGDSIERRRRWIEQATTEIDAALLG